MFFDPADPAFIADPYPAYDEMRGAQPLVWHDGLGMIVAVSHEGCSALLRNRSLGRIWTDASPLPAFAAFNLLHRNSLLESEPPKHTRLRRLIAGAFARGHTERLRPWVQELASTMVTRLAAQIADSGSADLMPVLAQPLPVEVIGELLGVPVADRALLAPWSNAIVKMYEYGLPADKAAAAEQAAAEFVAYMRSLAASRVCAPGDDLISDLVAASEDGDRLTEDELVATAVLLLMAGHEATVNVTGNGVQALMRNRSQWDRLRADPSLVDTAVEELIRFDAPLQLFERTATEDVTLLGVDIPAGSKVAALLGAAARDPLVFKEPDRLDVGRSPNPHLGFGAGIHYCVGAPLARVEVAAALRALLEQLPELQLADEPERRPEFVIRGIRTLPVTTR